MGFEHLSNLDWSHLDAPLTDVSPIQSDTNALVPLPGSLDQFMISGISVHSESHDPFLSYPFAPLLSPNYQSQSTIRKDVQFDDIDLDTWNDDNQLIPLSHQEVIEDVVPLNTISNSMAIRIHDENDDSGATFRGRSYEKRGNGRSKLNEMGFEEMRKYFYMPITRAAKEMKVGLTLLKKRCRELGIPRWPHRKMKSMKSLIHNVQQLAGKGTAGNESTKMELLDTLEEQKRLLEENPELDLTERTKRLRQACFKANYKRRIAMKSSNLANHSIGSF